MPISDYQLIEAWKQVLTLCQLRAGQTVTILTGQHTHPQTLATAITAANGFGVAVNRLDLQPLNGDRSPSRDPLAYVGTTALTGNPAAMAALKASDLVLDLMVLLFSPEQLQILESGTKILLVIEPPEVLVRLVPTEEDRRRVVAAADLISRSREMHVTSAAGTNLRCAIGHYAPILEYGFTDKPGRWDHWPSGFALTWPNELSAQGRVVLDRGDILLPLKFYVRTPIEMTVHNGYVTDIAGDLDADILKDYMAHFADHEGFAISHLGWGLQDRARWSSMMLYDREQTIAMEARAFAGNFLFSLGPNTEVGGSRNTACHVDIPMRNCTVTLDGLTVVEAGRILEREPAGVARQVEPV